MGEKRVHTASGRTFDQVQADQEKTRDTPEGNALREADSLYAKRKSERK